MSEQRVFLVPDGTDFNPGGPTLGDLKDKLEINVAVVTEAFEALGQAAESALPAIADFAAAFRVEVAAFEHTPSSALVKYMLGPRLSKKSRKWCDSLRVQEQKRTRDEKRAAQRRAIGLRDG